MTDASSIDKLEIELSGLVREARLGNAKSYKGLLTAALPFIRRQAVSQMSRFGYSHFSEDVMQETLIAVHLKLHTYDDGQSFLAWLRAVIKHKAIDFLRRNHINTVSIDDDRGLELAGSSDSEAGVVSRDLRGLLEKLKPPAGDIIYEFKVEGASVKEVAQKYNLSESNVKVIIHRGLEKLSALALGKGI